VDFLSNTFFIEQCKLYLLTEVVAMLWLLVAFRLIAYVTLTLVTFKFHQIEYVKLVLGSGDNCLHCFVENVFEKKITNFNLSRPSFMNIIVKTFLVFLCPMHSVLY
jgi:hypothetical protein